MVASLPAALADVQARGGFYLLSWAFFEDLPRRLTGPGRLRFIVQPTVAVLLGMRAGLGDCRDGRPPYLMMIATDRAHRREAFGETVHHVADLALMGILLDMVCQWLILGVAHPGAALVVGPVLIGLPYATARGVANRLARLTGA
jgi:hypothetical protein